MTLNQIIGNKERKSRIDTELWKKMNEKYSGIEDNHNELEKNNPNTAKTIYNDTYMLINGKSYAKTIDILQEILKNIPNNLHPTSTNISNAQIYRPLTFKENIEARVNDYETRFNQDNTQRSDDERQKLFKTHLHTCTGVAYKANTDRFKISLICNPLILITSNFNDCAIPIDYDSFTGKEFTSNSEKYYSRLTKSQFLNHKKYRFLYEDNKDLMNTYWNIIYSLTKKTDLMCLTLNKNVIKNEINSLFIKNISDYSDVSGMGFVNCGTEFLILNNSKNKIIK